MKLEECKKYLEHAEREWARLKEHLVRCERELNQLAFDRERLRLCQRELEEVRTELEVLRSVREELERFKRKIKHPDFWLTEISEPLVDRLEEATGVLEAYTKTGKPRLVADPDRLARQWAYRLYKLLGSPRNEQVRQAMETLLVALWIWLRMDITAALYAEDTE